VPILWVYYLPRQEHTMNTPAVYTAPSHYRVVNRHGDTVDTAETHHQALSVVDWYARHEPAAGPYRAVPAIPAQRRP